MPDDREKLRVVILTRSMGQIGIVSYETRDDILRKIYPDLTDVIHIEGVDDFGNRADHYLSTSGKGEIGCVILVRSASGSVGIPVPASVIMDPRMQPKQRTR